MRTLAQWGGEYQGRIQECNPIRKTRECASCLHLAASDIEETHFAPQGVHKCTWSATFRAKANSMLTMSSDWHDKLISSKSTGLTAHLQIPAGKDAMEGSEVPNRQFAARRG